MYEDIFESIRQAAEKRNLRERIMKRLEAWMLRTTGKITVRIFFSLSKSFPGFFGASILPG